MLPPLLVQISLAAGFSLLAEASLSFLGLGVQLPQASWGSMLGRGLPASRQPWMIVFPGIAIAVTVLAFNVVGDGLRGTHRPGNEAREMSTDMTTTPTSTGAREERSSQC